MTQLSENIIGKIKKERIAPVPRWHFLLKNYVFWGFFAIAVFLGSLAFSVIVEIFQVGDWDLMGHLQGGIFSSAVMMLPYFWFLFLCLFALIAFYNWKHTKKGYCIRRRWIFVGSISASVFLGSLLYALGWGAKVDYLMIKAMPAYDRSKHAARTQLWQQPDNGLFMGKIIDVSDTGEMVVLQDENGMAWSVSVVALPKEKNKEIEKKGKIVKVIGKKTGEKSFEAKEIRKCGDCFDDEDESEIEKILEKELGHEEDEE